MNENQPQTVPPVPPFVRFVCSSIPMTFDDSLSYYEALSALWKYMQDAVNVINNNATIEEEYIQLTKDMKDYMDHYFDNLDVQSEINAKLDKMAEDGTLSIIIGSYVDTVVTPAIDAIDDKVDAQNDTIDGLRAEVQSVASGSPLVASSTAGMTDTSKVYVNTTDGKWYYYNGTTWTVGGTYQGAAVADNSVDVASLGLDVKDATNISSPSVTFVDGKYYGKNGNEVTAYLLEAVTMQTTNPFLVKAGKTVAVKCLSYNNNTNICVINVTDQDGGNVRPKIFDDGSGVVKIFKYEVPADSYIVISCKKDSYGGIYVYDTSIDQENIKGNDVKEIFSHNLISDWTNGSTPNVVIENKTSSDYDYPTYKKFTVNYETGSGSYGWAYYAMFTRTLEAITTSSLTVAIDVRSETDSHLSCFLRVNNQTLPASPSSFTMFDLTSEYKRYVYTFNFTSRSITSISLILGEKDIFQDEYGDLTNSKFEIRYCGIVTGSNKNWLLNNPFTLADAKTQLGLDDKEDVEGLFSSFITFGSIGDSLASGESVANNTGSNVYVDNNDFSWGQFIAREHGMTCNNYNKGGMTTRSWLTDSEGLPKLLQNGSNNRAFIIGLGVNDANYLGSGYIGEASDIKSDFTQNEDTFYGNYGRIISYCKQVQPKCKIFMYTIARVGSQYDGYNNAIREIATLFDNVYLIDVNRSDYNTGFINNNLRSGHFNAIGYKAIADLMYKQISDYMLLHYTDFKQIEFIGTDYSWT